MNLHKKKSLDTDNYDIDGIMAIWHRDRYSIWIQYSS